MALLPSVVERGRCPLYNTVSNSIEEDMVNFSTLLR
jgi:hypothetical protein